MDLQAQAALMEHATEFTNSAHGFLKEKLGHTPNDQELLIFSSAVSSMNASWCYGKVYNSGGGREGADVWMQQIFVQVGLAVKQRGVPVTLQINLKSIQGAAPEKSPITQETPGLILCKCVTDATGQCPTCLKELHESLVQIIDVSATLEKFKVEERCHHCVQQLFDLTFAKVIEEKYSTVGETIRAMITGLAVQMASAHGVTSIPKIEAALAAFSKADES